MSSSSSSAKGKKAIAVKSDDAAADPGSSSSSSNVDKNQERLEKLRALRQRYVSRTNVPLPIRN